MSPPDPGPRRARLVGTLIAALALLAIGAWWLHREGPPRLEPPVRGDSTIGGGAARPGALALEAVAATREATGANASTPEADVAPSDATDTTARARTRSPRPFLLHVIDAETGAELREVTVLREADDSGAAIDDCELATALGLEPLASGAAPLQLLSPPVTPLERDTILVRAAGYERATLDIDWTSGGERTIELRPAGGFDLDLEGAPAEMQFTVRLWSMEALEVEAKRLRRRIERLRSPSNAVAALSPEWVARERRSLELLLAEVDPSLASPEVAALLQAIPPQRRTLAASFNVCRIDALAAGRWAVALLSVPREAMEPPTLHAFSRFQIVAGERTALTLPWQPAVPQRQVAVRGRVRFDRGWLEPGHDPLPSRVRLSTLVPGSSSPGYPSEELPLQEGERPEERRFECSALPIGPAEAEFATWPYRLRFDVPEPRDDTSAVEVELAIPAPMKLTVRTIASEGDSAIEPAQIQWCAANVPPGLHWPIASERSNDGAPLLLCLPAGEWRVLARQRHDADWPATFDRRVETSGQTLELLLHPEALLELEFRDGEAVVPIADSWIFGSQVVGAAIAEGIIGCLYDEHDSTRTVAIDGNGPALLHLEEPPGYAPIAPIEVNLVRGATQSLRVALQRLAR